MNDPNDYLEFTQRFGKYEVCLQYSKLGSWGMYDDLGSYYKSRVSVHQVQTKVGVSIFQVILGPLHLMFLRGQ